MAKRISKSAGGSSDSSDVSLRQVEDDDLPVFFQHQLDPVATHMAAFTAKDPADEDAFNAHWARILGDEGITTRSILLDGQVVGHVASFEQDGRLEITYWIGREHWGKGVATRALSLFLAEIEVRPIYARVAKDNTGSLRVLEKCGFTVCGHDRGFANARREEIDELVLVKGDN